MDKAILQIIQLTLAIATSQEARLVADALRDWVVALFSKGLITQVQQDALFQYVEAVCAARLARLVPAHWQVQPDPK